MNQETEIELTGQLDEKNQLSEDLTQISNESSDHTFTEVTTKQKRKRKSKKSIPVNV